MSTRKAELTVVAYHKLQLEHDHETAGTMITLMKVSLGQAELMRPTLHGNMDFIVWSTDRSFYVSTAMAWLISGDMALSGQYFNNFLLNVICASVSLDPAQLTSGCSFLRSACLRGERERDEDPSTTGSRLSGAGKIAIDGGD